MNSLIDCSPLDALALVQGLGSKLGLAVALPADRFAFNSVALRRVWTGAPGIAPYR